MNWNNYINSLKRITIEDIKNIIKNNIENPNKDDDDSVYYGFRKQDKYIFFGEIYFGGQISNPSILIHENEDNLCEELYNIIKNKFQDKFYFYFEHSLNGEYEYYGSTNDNTLEIQFPNFNQKHNTWIFNQIKKDKENKNKTKKLLLEKTKNE